MLCVFERASSVRARCITCGTEVSAPPSVAVSSIKCGCRRAPLTPANGPGTELHALLGRFGLTASGDCKCRSRAELMDANGCDWCEANIDEIVGWLRESAAERGLPFLDVAARLLVKRAISNARRKEAARAEGSSLHPER